MKRTNLISLALAAVLSSGVALAQPAPGHRPDPEAHLQHLSVILELSTQQQDQLRELLDAKRAELEARREAGREAREARRADREAFEQQITALLNDEQKAKFDALKAERHSQRGRRQGMHAGRRGEG